MRNAFILIGLVGLSLTGFSGIRTVADIPVSSVANRMYLADSENRPWWDSAWKKRAAILVSNVIGIRNERAVVDFVFDVGERVNPGEVRVVTPWETPVDCIAEEVEGGQEKIRIHFQTELRELENRPFFVYWDNPKARPVPICSPMALALSDRECRINNGVIDVTFDNLHRTPGLIRDIHLNALPTPNELLGRATGFAWEGFDFAVGTGEMGWSAARIVSNTSLKKTVRFESARADIDFTLYAGQPRIDYAYRLKNGNVGASISVAWAPGGGTAFDDFYYGGLAGKTVMFPASLDEVSDCIFPPRYYNFQWLASDWYALRDRRTHDVVGQVFDRKAVSSVAYLGLGSADGEQVRLSFAHRPSDGQPASGRGALVASVGGIDIVRREAEFLKNPPKVLVAGVQVWRDIPRPVPDLKHDYCVNVNLSGAKSSGPLKGEEWVSNLMKTIRSYGANTVLLGQVTNYRWTELPVPKELYDRAVEKYKPEWDKENRKFPEWKEGETFTGADLRKVCDEAHRQGMAVSTWHDDLPGLSHRTSVFNEKDNEFNRELEVLYPKCGVDTTFNTMGVGEANPLPADVVKAQGRNYWDWEDPSLHFKLRRGVAAKMKKFYDFAHKMNPGTTVMAFHSDNEELMRDMCMPWLVGALDTYFCEFVASMDFAKTKHGAKRQRAFFDNESGRTIFAHYYFFKMNADERIGQTEMPFVCGINGYSHENYTYGNTDRDYLEIPADFNRFAFYTQLGPKAAKMAPVKNLAVLRDMDCFEADILNRRTFKRSWWQTSRHDARVKAFTELYNYSYDVVFNAFFNAKSLGRYKAVYIPDDEVFAEGLAKELVAYVENGGGAVLEGSTGEKVKVGGRLLKDGEVVTCGKGKIVWTKEVLTDKMMVRDKKAMDAVVALVTSVGGQNPYAVTGSESLDSVLQASDEGMLLGVYNYGNELEKGNVTINCSISPSTSTPLYVLDVKRGVRVPYGDGFEIAIGPRQCGYYLIGDEGFTAVPMAKEAMWQGPSAESVAPNGNVPEMLTGETYDPIVAVELVDPGVNISRSEKLLFDVRRFTKDDLGALVRQLPAAHYLHVKVEAADSDVLFAEHANALKDFLRHGGGILFDGVLTGPCARQFLADVGVKDPTPTLKKGIGDSAGKMLETLAEDCLIRRHPTPGQFNKYLMYDRVFTDWDKATQIAPYVARLVPENALVVAQDKVLGKGKVLFNQCKSAFTDFYENDGLGNALISYLVGEFVEEYMKKASRAIGGPGKPYEEGGLECHR